MQRNMHAGVRLQNGWPTSEKVLTLDYQIESRLSLLGNTNVLRIVIAEELIFHIF